MQEFRDKYYHLYNRLVQAQTMIWQRTAFGRWPILLCERWEAWWNRTHPATPTKEVDDEAEEGEAP